MRFSPLPQTDLIKASFVFWIIWFHSKPNFALLTCNLQCKTKIAKCDPLSTARLCLGKVKNDSSVHFLTQKNIHLRFCDTVKRQWGRSLVLASESSGSCVLVVFFFLGSYRGRDRHSPDYFDESEPDNLPRLFVALFDYDPQSMSPNPDAAVEELPFKEGQIIKVGGDALRYM